MRITGYTKNLCRGGFGNVLNVKITNACNGNCAFCIEKHGYSPAQAPVQDLIDASNNLTEFKTVLILGGEPFMYPCLLEYLMGLRNKEKVYLTTNGTCFDLNTLPLIAKYLTSVSISLHHYNMYENAKIVGAYVAEPTLRTAISILHKSNVTVRLNVNLTQQGINNIEEATKMCEFAVRIGADIVRFVELQDPTDMFIYAATVFPNVGVHSDPYNEGCEQDIGKIAGIPVILKLACGLNSPYKPIPNNIKPRKCEIRVLYPNGEVLLGWATEGDIPKKV